MFMLTANPNDLGRSVADTSVGADLVRGAGLVGRFAGAGIIGCGAGIIASQATGWSW